MAFGSLAEKDRSTDEEWYQLASAPGSAFTAIVAANQSGVIALLREGIAMSKALKTTRGDSSLPPVVHELAETATEAPSLTSSDSDSPDDYDNAREEALARLSAAGETAAKLQPEEQDGYVRWVLELASSAATATKEKGSDTPINDSERETLTEIERLLRRG